MMMMMIKARMMNILRVVGVVVVVVVAEKRRMVQLNLLRLANHGPVFNRQRSRVRHGRYVSQNACSLNVRIRNQE